jgi:hypothetical protein
VRTAIGLASANLDTQLTDLPTVAEFEARTIVSANYGTAANQSTIIGYIDTEVGAIKAKTDQLTFTVANQVDSNALSGGGGLDAAGVRAAVGLASANLDTQLGDMPTNAELATALGTADDATLAAIASLNNLSAAQVNAEVLDVLNVDTFAELAAPPAATSTLKDKITWLFMWARNRSTQTATQRKLYADNATSVVGTETVSDDGTTYDKGEVA